MSKKRDIRQIEAIAKLFGMDAAERREFGDYVESCKRKHEAGSGGEGDFAFAELRRLAEEFREEQK